MKDITANIGELLAEKPGTLVSITVKANAKLRMDTSTVPFYRLEEDMKPMIGRVISGHIIWEESDRYQKMVTIVDSWNPEEGKPVSGECNSKRFLYNSIDSFVFPNN